MLAGTTYAPTPVADELGIATAVGVAVAPGAGVGVGVGTEAVGEPEDAALALGDGLAWGDTLAPGCGDEVETGVIDAPGAGDTPDAGEASGTCGAPPPPEHPAQAKANAAAISAEDERRAIIPSVSAL